MAQTEPSAVAEAPMIARRSDARLLRNIGLLAGSQVTTWGITVLWTLIVPRLLGPRQMGMITVAISATSIVSTLVAMGVTLLLVKEIASNRDRAPHLVGAALVMEALLYVPAVAVIVLFITLSRFDAQQDAVLLLAAAGMLPTVLRGPLEASLRAIERMEYSALSGVIAKIANSAGGVGLVLLGLGAIPLTILGGAVEVLLLGLNVGWFQRYFKLDWRVTRGAVIRLFTASVPYGATYLVSNVYTYIDAVMLASLTASTVVGWYGVSTRLLGTLMFLPVIVSTALLPRLSAVFHSDPKEVIVQVRPVFELILAFSLPITAGTILVAGPVIRLLYGPAFAHSAEVLAIAVISVPFTYFNIIVWQVLVASNRQWVWAKVMVAATVLNIALNGALILLFQDRYHNGAVGSAIALVATEAFMTAVALWLLPGLLTRRSWNRLLRSLLATLVMSGAVWWANSYELAAETLVGVAVFTVAALALRIVHISELGVLAGKLPAPLKYIPSQARRLFAVRGRR